MVLGKKRRDEFDALFERDRTSPGAVQRERWLRAHPALADVPPLSASRERSVSFLCALQGLLEFLRRPAEYLELAGLSGAVWLPAAAEREPCPSAWTIRQREFFLEELGRALELPLVELPALVGDDRAADFQRLCGDTVKESLEAGVPLLALGGWRGRSPWEWGLLTGWDEVAHLPVGRPPAEVEDEAPCPVRRRRRKDDPPPYPPPRRFDALPYVLVAARPKAAERYEGFLVREALARALKLLHDAAFDVPGAPPRARGWHSGTGFWKLWESRFIRLMQGGRFCETCGAADEDCFMRLLEEFRRARRQAQAFLALAIEEVEPELPRAGALLREAEIAAGWLVDQELLAAPPAEVREKLREHLGRRSVLAALHDAAELEAELTRRLEAALAALPEEPPRRRHGGRRRPRR